MTEDYRPPATTGDRIRAGLALQMIAATTGISIERMTARARLKGPACRARWLAMYLSHVAFDWPIDRVGLAFGLNRATAAKACRWAEDERDLPLIDTLMNRLERCALDIVQGPACELRS